MRKSPDFKSICKNCNGCLRLCTAFAILFICVNLAGCGGLRNTTIKQEDVTSGSVLSSQKEPQEDTSFKAEDADVSIEKESVRQSLQEMIDGPDGDRSLAVIPDTITSVMYSCNGDVVNVDFDNSIYELDTYKRILCLFEVTKGLCKVDNVDMVSFTAEGIPLVDGKGTPYGLLNENSFVENEGVLFNSYEKAELTLYFAAEDGKSLVETKQSVVYSSNLAVDRLVVDKLIEGPQSVGAYATINPDTAVNVVTTLDGVCYVDLGNEFLNKITNVTDEVMIYSIVDSLTALNGINKVQILIDGQNGDERINELFERNLEIVEQK